MSFPLWNHYKRRLRRHLKTRFNYIQITLNGNRITKLTDFTKPALKPVLLIQGFGSTRQAFSVLEARLRRDGFDVFSLKLGGLFGTLNTRGIETLALEIRERLRSLRARFKLGKVHIIGHSKGGLIGRYLVSCLDGHEDVSTVITMGTPHQGSTTAKLMRFTPVGMVSRGIRDMHPRSKVMCRLTTAPIPSGVRIISIGSTEDRIVASAQCEINLPGTTTVILHGISHSDYLLKQSVYDVIRTYLPKE